MKLLDIIIPTYNNKNGLRRTLNSITILKNVNVIVIDDASNLDYSDILNEYPFIKFYQLNINQGPGIARQYGLEHSKGTYILFLDTGDYFYENGLKYILEQITKNMYIKMFDFSYVYDNNNVLKDVPDDKIIASIYKRSFIEKYNVHFSKEGSYANEDYGFSRACRLLLKQEENFCAFPIIKMIKIPVLYEHIDKNSVTQINEKEYFYTKLSNGIIINGIHAIDIIKNHVNLDLIIEELNYIMAQEYFFFLSILYERPELADDTWQIIQKFYIEKYKIYEKDAIKILPTIFTQSILPQIKIRSKQWKDKKILPFNILRFVKELETEKVLPLRYLTSI